VTDLDRLAASLDALALRFHEPAANDLARRSHDCIE
jgi:hypothetical protein